MEFLKVFLSALVLLVITALVFFAIYFLFPDFSENAFGISAYSEGFVLGSNGVSENGTIEDIAHATTIAVRTSFQNTPPPPLLLPDISLL